MSRVMATSTWLPKRSRSGRGNEMKQLWELSWRNWKCELWVQFHINEWGLAALIHQEKWGDPGWVGVATQCTVLCFSIDASVTHRRQNEQREACGNPAR